jgi:hypothetical protein
VRGNKRQQTQSVSAGCSPLSLYTKGKQQNAMHSLHIINFIVAYVSSFCGLPFLGPVVLGLIPGLATGLQDYLLKRVRPFAPQFEFN